MKTHTTLPILAMAIVLTTSCHKNPIKTGNDTYPLPPLHTKNYLTINRLPVLNDTATFTIETYLYKLSPFLDSVFDNSIPITTWIAFGDSNCSPSAPDTLDHPFQFLGDSVWVDYLREGERASHSVNVKAKETGKWIIYGIGFMHPDTFFNRIGGPGPGGICEHDTIFVKIGTDTSTYWHP